jgi:hypothetical protein
VTSGELFNLPDSVSSAVNRSLILASEVEEDLMRWPVKQSHRRE